MQIRSVLCAMLLIQGLIQSQPARPASAPAQASIPIPSQTQATERMDALLSRSFRPDAPGASVLVMKGDTILLKKGYGLANVELQVSMRPDMVFHVASVGKQFVAAGILLLADEGKISLKDPVRRHWPESPTSWASITIEHLLTHTSGIANPFRDPEYRRHMRDDLAPEQIVAWAAAKPLLAEPGVQFHYAPVNYTLLALLIERTSGQSLANFLEQRFFKPLGMTHTTWDQAPGITRGRVSPYSPGPRPSPYVSPSHNYGGGCFYSSTEDLATWTRALQGGRLLRPTSLQAMNRAYLLKDGTNTHYGYGIRSHGTPTDPYLQSNGDIHGFHAEVVFQPASRVFVAILMNGEELNTSLDPLAKRIAALAGGTTVQEPAGVSLPESSLRPLTGRYRQEGRDLTIRLEGRRLVCQMDQDAPEALSPLSATTFLFDEDPDERITFDLQDGTPIRLRLGRVDRAPGPVYNRVPESPHR